MDKINIERVSRRDFLKTTGMAAGGLMLWACQPLSGKKEFTRTTPINAFIKIGEDNLVTLVSHQAEMGQGVQTTLPAILADELGADWNNVRIVNGLTDPAYKNPKYQFQFSGNAESVRSFHPVLRKMGATAREMLVEVAAGKWQVEPSSLIVENSYIINISENKKFSFGELVEEASMLTPPEDPILKDPSQWKLVGNKALNRVDIPAKVFGTAEFGIDVEREGLVYGAIEICPYFGGKIINVDEIRTRELQGIIDVVRIPVANPVFSYRPGFPKKEAVVVVATSYWKARIGLMNLDITYDKGPNYKMDSASLFQEYVEKMESSEWYETLKEGSPVPMLEKSKKTYSNTYYSAWQSHATMEPMNATAEVRKDIIEVWAPTQGQEMAQILLEKLMGVPKENIIVNRTYLGGGFGRRLLADYIYQAAFVSKKVERPVKIIWSREEDIRHDFYRPGVLHRMSAVVDTEGYPEAVKLQQVTPSILQAALSQEFVFEGEDPSVVEGGKETPYRFENYLVQTHLLRVPPSTSVWRSTGYGPNVFAVESFLDELAKLAGIDAIAYRKKIVANPRSKGVLDAVGDASGWYGERKEGHYMGVALSHSFETFVAQVIEISIDPFGILDIHKISTAVDCGTVLDPRLTRASIESGINWGLTAALVSEINFSEGRTLESNFHDFQMFSLPEFPVDIETVFVDSGEKIGGIAESGPICVAPALCNAIHAATGKRFTRLPLKHDGIYTRHSANFLPMNELNKKINFS